MANYSKEYYQKHKENSYSNKFRKLIFGRDNWQCQICGSSKKLEIHHIDGEMGGGGLPLKKKNNNLDNIITLCLKCHHKIDGWKRGEGNKLKNRWSRKFIKCLNCGTTTRKHIANGLCIRCYELTRRGYKTDYYRKHYGVLTSHLEGVLLIN